MKFSDWLLEKKNSRGKKVPTPPTSTSAPTRGANQDQSGFGVKHDVADYTISDSVHAHNLDKPAHQPEWEKETPATRKKLVKHAFTPSQKRAYSEAVVMGVGHDTKGSLSAQIRTGARGTTLNAPASAHSLQRSADATSRAKEMDARKRAEDQKKEKEKQLSQRKANQKPMMEFKEFLCLDESDIKSRLGDIYKHHHSQAAGHQKASEDSHKKSMDHLNQAIKAHKSENSEVQKFHLQRAEAEKNKADLHAQEASRSAGAKTKTRELIFKQRDKFKNEKIDEK